MNDLELIEQNGQKGIDSRQVAEMVEKDHSNLLRDIRGYIEAIQKDPNSKLKAGNYFIDRFYFDKQGQERTGYLVTKMGCDMIANKMIGEKGIRFTATYVEKFHEMDSRIQSFKLPKTFSEALRELATTFEAKELAEAQLLIAAPKVEFYDAVAGSKDAIAIGEAAKVLAIPGMGQNNLFKALRDKGVLMGNNVPFQEMIDRGYFRVIEQKFNKSNGDVCVSLKTLVYQKGLDYIRKALMKGEGQ